MGNEISITAESKALHKANVSSSALKINVANWGWKVLSPEDKVKPVALFHRHDDAVKFAVMKWGKFGDWDVKCCDKRIPLHCY